MCCGEEQAKPFAFVTIGAGGGVLVSLLPRRPPAHTHHDTHASGGRRPETSVRRGACVRRVGWAPRWRTEPNARILRGLRSGGATAVWRGSVRQTDAPRGGRRCWRS